MAGLGALAKTVWDVISEIEGMLDKREKEMDKQTIGTTQSIKREFSRTISLLIWYLRPHWHGTMGTDVIGGETSCVDCGYTEIVGAGGEYCPVPSCPSHKKWRMVIGPSYEPPKRDLRFPESTFTPEFAPIIVRRVPTKRKPK